MKSKKPWWHVIFMNPFFRDPNIRSSFYLRDGFPPGLKLFFCQSKAPGRDFGDHARPECGAQQLLKAWTRWDFYCSRASPVKLVITQLANYIMVIFMILHRIYSLHQFILSRFLEQQLSFQGLNKKKIEKRMHADIITINSEFLLRGFKFALSGVCTFKWLRKWKRLTFSSTPSVDFRGKN